MIPYEPDAAYFDDIDAQPNAGPKGRPIIFGGLMVRAILGGRKTQTRRVIDIGTYREDAEPRCKYGVVGDTLWVRETWAYYGDMNSIIYRADDERSAVRWHPAIHMARRASRITLRITGLELQQLHDITADDAVGEGVFRWDDADGTPHYGTDRADVWERDPRAAFRRLWDRINAQRGFPWATNPMVWRIQFERIDP